MPELPEVETTRRGISPHVLNKPISAVIIRQYRLRWPVLKSLNKKLIGQKILKLDRRAKYLIFHFQRGYMLLHLGMSGSLRVLNEATAPEKHDHVDIIFDDDCCLRFRDPRRFGSIHWTGQQPLQHKLLRRLGPEPLGELFTAEHLYAHSRKRKQSVKTFIMDSRIVVGVGNIYASEALFESGIHPKRKAGNVSLSRYGSLTHSIKRVLNEAIKKGGTTLRDFVNSDGSPGYFRHELNVYGRAGQPCKLCLTKIKRCVSGQRSTYYCPQCQH